MTRTPRGQMRLAVDATLGFVAEAWTGGEWIRLKYLSLNLRRGDPMARPGNVIVDIQAELLEPPPAKRLVPVGTVIEVDEARRRWGAHYDSIPISQLHNKRDEDGLWVPYVDGDGINAKVHYILQWKPPA